MRGITGRLNWEGPGSVYDSNNKWIGKGFLEGNNLLEVKINDEIFKEIIFGSDSVSRHGLLIHPGKRHYPT